MARVVGLLNPDQCGSLAGLSTLDACTTVTHATIIPHFAKRKLSTLFLDIEVGFDKLNPQQHSPMVQSRGVNPYLVSWTRSFLTGRSSRLLFQGSPKVIPRLPLGPPRAP